MVLSECFAFEHVLPALIFRLKGQFSRLAQQQSRFHSTQAAQVINRVALRLPSSAHSVYYYDTIGNVSTSNFRSGQANSARRGRVIDSLLELRPRYPILGGWNYSFTVGWDSPLSEVLKVEPDGKQVCTTISVEKLT
jgi:oligosaccharyltransferase complex subunit alpha (ribophorin I)